MILLSLDAHGNLTRRHFLQVAGASVAGAGFLGQISLHADELKKNGRACILVWLGGAPSQMELWDPKPGTANGGETKAIDTAVSGIKIAHFWPKVAQRMKDVALLRTIVGKEAAHERGAYHLHTGRRLTGASRHPNFGSVVAHEIGDPKSDMPNFVSVGSTLSSGFLGVQFAPFEVSRPGELPENVAKPVGDDRLSRRLALLDSQNKDFAKTGAEKLVQERQTLYERANKLVNSPRLKAFQLDGEKDETKTAYGAGKFGQGLLVARRLVESGIPFVEVQRGGWDMHTDLYDRIKPAAAEVDQGLSQLLIDLKQRELLAKTLVICMGEFGRTPKLNSRGGKPGRDHWARNFNVLLAGGGIKGGQAIGKTSDNGQEITDRPLSVDDLFQSFCKAMTIDAGKELYTPEGRPLKIVDGGQPVKELFA